MTMKKITFLGSLFLSLFSQAQTFTDNFDSYTAGLGLKAQSAGAWTTWSGAASPTDDVLVSNADAASGANSLHFVSTASTGGPSDVIRNFGVLNTGQFSMAFNMKVATGAAAYFNLQKTAVPGATYTLDAVFGDDGTLVFNQQGDFLATYPQGSWFNFRLDINFNTNKWEVFFDNVSQGSFSNSVNQIASIDLFPVDAVTPFLSDFFIDDFSTIVTPYTLPSLNGAVNYGSFNGGNIAGNSVPISLKVKNLGVGIVTSFDIAANYNGITENRSFSGLSMASLSEQTFNMLNNITLIAGSNPLTFTISNVNGAGADGDANDNVGTININPIVPAAGKMVVSEEGTGTWCGWCVRGAVYMDLMAAKYSNYWAGIAVHNGDPMVVATYDAGIGALIPGYPSALVDRGPEQDPSAMEASILSRLQIAPKALITNGATWDASTRTLNVSVSANFQVSATNAYKLACVLTEDGVTGTASGYNQSNYYQGGGSGVMGGYESLPNPVLAANMVYDHVARAIQPSFAGSNSAFPATIASGATYTMTFTFVLPSTWDETKMEIVGMLIDGSGKVDNAGKATITEAVANGYVAGIQNLFSSDVSQADDVFQIYPNPASTSTMVTINLKKESQVELKVIDMTGKEVAARNYGSMSGASTIQMNTSSLEAGMYLVELSINNEKTTKRLVIR
jgi:hypothetical protein